MASAVPHRLSHFIQSSQNPYDQGLIMPLEAAPVAQVKDVDTKKGIVRGYFSAFGNIDAYREIVVPGAFKKTIREWGPDGTSRIKHLLHHNPTWAAGVVQELEEDAHGLLFTSKLLSTDRGHDTLIEYDEGHFTEHSIGFRLIKWEYDDDEDVLLLVEIQLYEGSAVTWGANPDTPVVDIKALKDDPAALDGVASKIRSIQRCLKREISDMRAVELEAELSSLRLLVAEWDNALRSEIGLEPRSEPASPGDATHGGAKPLSKDEATLHIARQLKEIINN